jgi:hypothetical protein
MKFLVNPGGKTMAVARKRNRKGQFVKGRATTRKRTTTPRRKAATRAVARRTYRRNPAKPDVVKMVTRGALTATQVLLGKAATRAVPDMLNLPKAGNAGLATQVAVALGLGYVGEMFFSKATAAALLAGGMTAPVESLLVSANIPYVSDALRATDAPVAGYVMPRTPSLPLSGYVTHGGDQSYPAEAEDGSAYWM